MRSGGGVLVLSILQAVVGLSLLGIYEGYKTQFFNTSNAGKDAPASVTVRNLSFRSPMDFVYWLSIINNIFSAFGFFGVLHAQKELVTGFFVYNAIATVVAFSFFVDICADIKIRYAGEPAGLTPYEKAAAAFLFFNFLLSICSTVFAVKAIEEIKIKSREEFNRMSILSDTLQYEADQ